MWVTSALIYATNAENIAIEGEGRINGQGHGRIYFPSKEDPIHRRPFLILLWNCKNIYITDITLDNPGFFTFMAEKSEYILAERVKIHSMETENGDGLDFDGCCHVIIKDCIFETGDDSISPKTNYPGWPCVDFEISGCYFKSVWAGFRLGTETTSDMRDITLWNCVFDDCNDAIKIQDCGSGCLQDITIKNVVMRNVHRPIFMTINSYRLSKYETSIRPIPGGIRNICIEGVTVIQPNFGEEYQRNCLIISGDKEIPVRDVTIKDFHMVIQGPVPEGARGRAGVPEYLDYTTIYADIFSISGGFPASGPYVRHVKGIHMEECDWICMNGDERPVMFMSDVEDACITLNRALTDGNCLVQAVEANVEVKDCVLNGQPVCGVTSLNEKETEKYTTIKNCSERTRELFNSFATLVDKAQNMPYRNFAEYTDWAKEGNVWRTILMLDNPKSLLVLKSFGDMEVWLNGVCVGNCFLEETYRDVILWACELKEYAVKGANRLEIRWRDVTQHGGMVSKLPFGAFIEKNVGIFSMDVCGFKTE